MSEIKNRIFTSEIYNIIKLMQYDMTNYNKLRYVNSDNSVVQDYFGKNYIKEIFIGLKQVPENIKINTINNYSV